ncbi:ATP/GTP-binding protein [Streptomyces sp. NPDC059783]|uniref:AAA family ATPase n=1 Tax=Streptomyces sp. NPDC059783 TaxID=3346944 RepID=UPI00364AE130
MIIWLNGAFGSGKSTLAAGLRRALPGAAVADPEAVGDLLRSTLAGHALKPRDYQDLPPDHTGSPVIVPMTVLNPSYAEEIFAPLRRGGGFHHLVVHTDPAALTERIEASDEYPGDPERSEAVRAYRRRAADYQQSAAWLHARGHVIDTTTLTAGQTLQAALAHLHTAA